MAGKVLTYSELFDIISSCVPDYTSSYSSFCYQFYGSNTDITTNKCAVKISSSSQLEQAFSEVIPSIDRYITSNPAVSSLTSNIAANKLFPAEDFTVDPRNKYYGCKIANNNAVNIITTGATITNEDKAIISVRLYKSSDTSPLGTTSIEALSYTMNSFTEASQAQAPGIGKVVLMETGIKIGVCIQFPNKISSISNAKVSLVDGSGTIIQLTGAKQNANYVYFTSTETLTISLLKRLKTISSLQFTGTYTLEPKLVYVFDLTKNKTIYGTSIQTTPLFEATSGLGIDTDKHATTIYAGDFNTPVWVDNSSYAVYSNGKISFPYSVDIHAALLQASSQSTNNYCFLRVSLQTNYGYATLYYVIKKTGSTTGQTYDTGSAYPVFIDVSNNTSGTVMQVQGYSMNGSSVNIYNPKMIGDNSMTYQSGYKTVTANQIHYFDRTPAPNPHFVYLRQFATGNKFVIGGNESQTISQITNPEPYYIISNAYKTTSTAIMTLVKDLNTNNKITYSIRNY